MKPDATIPFRLPMPALALLAGLACCACSAPRLDLDAWRAREAVARPGPGRGPLPEGLAEVERLRQRQELDAARRLALALAAEHPDDAWAQLAASRAESDGMLLLDDDESARDHAAASALDYARRAAELGADSGAARAQLAWALGTTTHLQPMGERAEHAQHTLRAGESALALEPEQPTALATLAILNLRLETLPWIADLMATGLPDSSLEQAEDHARRAVAARASREHRLILARVLVAADREAEARAVLLEGLEAGERFPRDRILEAPLRGLLEDL